MAFPGAIRQAAGGRTSAGRTAAGGRSTAMEVAGAAVEQLPVTLGQYGGYQEIAETQTDIANAVVASRRVLESRYGDVTFTKLGAFMWNAVGNVRLGIYSDSAGAPGTLLAAAPEAAVANGRVESTLASPLTLSPGAYWLAANLSSNSAGLGTVTGFQVEQSIFASSAYGALPSTFPAGGSQQDLHRCVYALGTADTLTKPADPAVPAAPAPISGEGYSLVFRDECQWLDRTKWTDQVWWDGPGRPNTQYVSGGVLHLVAYQSDGWPNVTMDTLGFLDDLVFGYFEARMRSTGNRADFPAFWLFSTDWAKRSSCVAGDRASEIDMVELWGNQFPTVFSGTVHSDSANNCTANQQSQNSWQDRDPETMVGEWHTYAVKWEPTLLSWYIDDVLSHTVTVGAGTNWTELDQHPMHVILYQWPDRGNTIDGGTWPLPTAGVDPAEIHTEFDWIRVWQVA